MSNLTPFEFEENFSSYRDDVKERYSRPIWYNLDRLYYNWTTGSDKRGPPSTARKILSKLHFEKQLLRKYTTQRSENLDSTKVLIAFVNPCRNEYVPLFLPIIQKPGIDSDCVTIFTSRERWNDEISFDDFRDSSFLYEEDLYSYRVYYRAKRDYKELRNEISDLCEQFELNSYERYSTRLYFKRLFIDKHIFLEALSHTCPNVIYTVQFSSSRGSLAAIDAYSNNYDITTVIMQHGAFTEDDFTTHLGGADWGLLWGEYFESLLEKKDHMVVPEEVTIVGNPNLHRRIRAHARDPAEPLDSTPTVLYASTGLMDKIDALRMFARTVSDRDDIDVVYKPHPSGEQKKYANIIEEGLIQPSDVVRDTDVYELIGNSALVAGTESTVLSEAIALNVPSLQIWPNRQRTNLHRYGLRSVSSPEELNREITLILSSDSYRQEVLSNERNLVRLLFDDVENSANNISSFIANICGK